MQANIYIPTKGRFESNNTASLLDKAGIAHYLVIEPQEKAFYKGNLIILPEDDKGIAYSRNYILKHAKEAGIDWAIMIDDDVTSFGIVENKRCFHARRLDQIKAGYFMITGTGNAIKALLIF